MQGQASGSLAQEVALHLLAKCQPSSCWPVPRSPPRASLRLCWPANKQRECTATRTWDSHIQVASPVPRLEPTTAINHLGSANTNGQLQELQKGVALRGAEEILLY